APSAPRAGHPYRHRPARGADGAGLIASSASRARPCLGAPSVAAPGMRAPLIVSGRGAGAGRGSTATQPDSAVTATPTRASVVLLVRSIRTTLLVAAPVVEPTGPGMARTDDTGQP
ncbi:hypothetical protein, partial [Streptomyces corynorhini]|uniref:hypothetical protein n=1 Tax=Streptomyces corynorhini TaxID=2282652 RepID=UPI00389A5C0A